MPLSRDSGESCQRGNPLPLSRDAASDGFPRRLFYLGETYAKIRFYKVNIDYIKYLHTIDSRVQYNPNRQDAYTENRPYVGILLSVNGKDFFAPMEHPRPAHQKLKNNPHIFKIDGGRYGLVGLNNMLPVPPSQLVPFNLCST